MSLSPRRVVICCIAKLALVGWSLPAIAVPAADIGVMPVPMASPLPVPPDSIVRPTVVFAKKDGKGGGGGSGSSGQEKDEGKDDNKDKKDKDKDDKDKKDKDDKGKKDKGGKGKKDKDDKGKKDKGGKDDKDKDDKDDKGRKDNGGKDKKDKGDKGKKDNGGKDKKDNGDKGKKDNGGKDKKDKDDKDKDDKDKDDKDKDDNKDNKDEDDKEDKRNEEEKKDKDDNRDEDDDDEAGEEGRKDRKDNDDDASGQQDDQSSDDGGQDHDGNERHAQDQGAADDRQDQETGEGSQYHSGDNESDVAEPEQPTGNGQDTGAESPTDGAQPGSNAVPGVVTLSWSPPTENEDGSPLTDLAGYRIYYRDITGEHSESLQLDNPGLSTIVIEGLDAGTWEFTMTSVNATGIESGRSNSITRTVEGPASTEDSPASVTTVEQKDAAAPAEAPDPGSSSGDSAPYLVLSGTPPGAVTAGDLYLFAPGFESGGQTPPVFAIEGLPHWAGFDEVTGELFGTPDDADIGLYEAISIAATDGVVETSLPPFTIEVVAPGAAQGLVTLSWAPPTENEDGSYLVDLAGYWIYWGNNPGTYTEWMKIDNPGLTTIVIEDLVPGFWEFAMTSFNAAGVESSLSNTVTRFVE